MKSAKPSIGTSKRSRVETYTTTPTFGAMPAVEETFVDLIAAVDPSSGVDEVDPTVAPPLSLRAMMQSFTTTQATHEQLLDEL